MRSIYSDQLGGKLHQRDVLLSRTLEFKGWGNQDWTLMGIKRRSRNLEKKGRMNVLEMIIIIFLPGRVDRMTFGVQKRENQDHGWIKE